MSKKTGPLSPDQKIINKDEPFALGETDPLRLLQELQVHKIELESQNEALLVARNNAESAAASFTDLYNFAPVGYLTLNTDGLITRANHASARLLGTERENLQGKNLIHFVAEASLADFNTLIAKSDLETHLPAYEITLRGNSSSTVLMEVSSNENAVEKRLILTDITIRKQIEKKLQEREFWLSETQRIGSIGSYELDIVADEWISSAILEQLFGLVDDDNGHKSTSKWIKRIHPDDRKELLNYFSKKLSVKDKQIDKEYRIVRANDAEIRWVWQHGEITFDMGGKPSRIIGTIQDITERKQAQVKLQLAASVFTHAHEGIMITDAKGMVLDVNNTFTQITGFTRGDTLGQNAQKLLSDDQSAERHSIMWQSAADKGYWYGEVWSRRKNGERFPEMISISAVNDVNAKTLHYVSLITDITDIKAHQNQLEHAAHYDALTNLPNRTLLADRLPHKLLQHQRNGKMLAVVYLDLDGFKTINDSHGHSMGDQLLIKLSQRMSEALREGDMLARIGGDEFVAIIGNLDDPSHCIPVLDRLLHASSKAVIINDTRLKVSASIGVSIYPTCGIEADLLLRQADQAMYMAKESDKNCYHFFDINSAEEQRNLQEELNEIRRALDQNEFLLYYQPKINMRTGEVVGAEALIRWLHPERGLLGPIEFLHIIEEHSIRLEVGDWVINSALRQMSYWNELNQQIPVSVNVGAYQLQDSNFLSKLAISLTNNPSIQASQLELEILETSALEDVSQVSALIQDCQGLGVGFSLDDFGTGYSSLAYLKRLPVGSIKIDQSFVRDMLIDSDDLAIVKGIIGLAEVFKRQVIAEGVETLAHGEVLLSLGCEIAQGYGIARPMPASELPLWIEQWHANPAWTA
tara:strand:+ start:9554 stop:12154 length:2601 start_codon:yes stop_codon:yes gene_type:complete